MFGWMLALVGLVPLWVAYRAIQRGDVSVGDKVEQTRYTREEAPGSFWTGVAFYALLGVALIVLGCLVIAGVIET